MSLPAASYLGPYKIAALVGAGGMGEVYRAHDERLGRDVAIKVLHQDSIADPDRQRRFALEARAASALNHPNILTVFDVGLADGVAYIVTELVEGEPLNAIIARGPMPVRRALDIAIQIAAGLAAAHQAGIVHRDVKPANLMIATDGRVKILDFGLAKSLRQSASPGAAQPAETAPGFVVGTASYMSPEQVRGDVLDHRSDQFALGLVLYAMIAGKPAFARSSAVGTMAAIVEEHPQPLGEVNPAVPVPLRWSVERCLAKEREARYESTADLQRELQTIRNHIDEFIPVVPGPAPDAPASAPDAATPVPPRRRFRLLPVIVALAALLAGAIVTEELIIPQSAADLAACRLTPVATSGEFARSPAWSADGKSLAFTAVTRGVRQVFVRELTAPTAGQITNSAADCERPFWSPDDSRIYFFSSGATGFDLLSTGATGGAADVVERNVSAAALASDGRTLAFLRADPTGKEPLSLWISNLATHTPRRFTGRPFDSAKYQLGHLAFSRAGDRLGLWLLRWDGVAELWILSWPDGQAAAPLQAGLSSYGFSWMPDGRNIVFGGVVPGSQGADLQMLDTRNGRIRTLSFLTRDAVEAAASPDGRRIAFVASNDNFELLSVPVDGQPVQSIHGTGRNEFDPVWSPTGDQMAYVTDRIGTSQIWLRGVRDGWDRPLITERDFGQAWVAAFGEPNFSPDGRRIAYSVAGSAGHAVYLSSVAGGKPIRLSADTADESSPSWNGEGSWIAYLRGTGGSWSLVKAPSSGNAQPVVLREGCLPSHPKWNRANSHWIACVTAEGLTLISEDGKETVPLSRDRWLVYGWSHDGKTLHGVKEDAARRRVIAALDIETKTLTVSGELHLPLGSELSGFTMALDDKTFATSASHPSGDIWTLDGFRQPGLLTWFR